MQEAVHISEKGHRRGWAEAGWRGTLGTPVGQSPAGAEAGWTIEETKWSILILFFTGLPLPSLRVHLRGRQNREVGAQGPELVLPNLERALLNLEQVPPQSLVLDL